MDPILPVTVAAAAAVLLAGLVARGLRLPAILAYLLAGILLGPHGAGVISDPALSSRLGEFGVVLLLFFVGMEVSVPRLLVGWRIAVLGTLLQIALSVGVIWAFGAALGWPVGRIVLLGFVVSLSSTALVVGLLRQQGRLDDEVGRDTLGILLVQDLALVPMLITIGVMSGETPSLGAAGAQALGALGVAGVLGYAFTRERLRVPFERWIEADTELQVFAAGVLCLGCAWLTALAGLSTALGAFVAGILVSQADATRWVHRSLDPLRVLFVALFFAAVGMLIDLTFVREHALLLASLTAAVLLVNTAINYGILRLLDAGEEGSLQAAVMLAPIGEFSFVLAAVGLQSGLVTDFSHKMTIALIAITLVVGPVWITGVTRLAHLRARRAG